MKFTDHPVQTIISIPDEQPIKDAREWVLKVTFTTVDGDNHIIHQRFGTKRDALAYKAAHVNGKTPEWPTHVTTVDGRTWGYTEHIGAYRAPA